MSRQNSGTVRLAFNSGEFSPLLDARPDIERSGAACRELLNMAPTDYGAAKRRAGTVFVAYAREGAAPPQPEPEPPDPGSSLSGVANAVAIDALGDFVAAGPAFFEDGETPLSGEAIRIDGGNGTRDATFAFTHEDVGLDGVWVQPSGKVLVFAKQADAFAGSLLRFTDLGAADATWTTDAAVTQIYAAAMLPDGRVAIAGEISAEVGIALLGIDGALDGTFAFLADGSGIGARLFMASGDRIAYQDGAALEALKLADFSGVSVLATAWADSWIATSMCELSDGTFIVAGHKTVSAITTRRVWKLNADGTRDASFSPFYQGGAVNAGNPIGAMLAMGQTAVLGISESPYLVRMNDDGTQDLSWQPGHSAPVAALLADGEGGVVVAGTSGTINGTPRGPLVRYSALGGAVW